MKNFKLIGLIGLLTISHLTLSPSEWYPNWQPTPSFHEWLKNWQPGQSQGPNQEYSDEYLMKLKEELFKESPQEQTDNESDDQTQEENDPRSTFFDLFLNMFTPEDKILFENAMESQNMEEANAIIRKYDSVATELLTENPNLAIAITAANAASLEDAVIRNDPSTIRTLIRTGAADPNRLNHNGETMLHVAARHNNADAAQELVLQGADPFITNSEDQTPFEINAPSETTDTILWAHNNMPW